MRGEHFLYFNNSRIYAPLPRGLRLMPFLRRWICCCRFVAYYYFECWSLYFLCFVVRYFMSILVLQSSWWERESWLLCLVCLPGVSWLLRDSSSWFHGFICSLWLCFFLIKLAYHFSNLNSIFAEKCQQYMTINICVLCLLWLVLLVKC